jgi:hypothetical protein
MAPFLCRLSASWVGAFCLICCALPCCAAADQALLTKENFDRIQNGLTTEEAKAILGKPSGGMGTAKDWTSTWYSPDRKSKIEVHFTDKIVDRKSTTFEWGKPAADPTPAQAAPAKARPGGTPEKETDPKLAPYLRALRSPEEKERDKALKSLVRMKRDEDLAEQVSKIMQARLRDKDDGTRLLAQEGMRKWVTPANADFFLTELAHKPKTDRPNDPDRDRQQFAVAMLVKLKEPRAVPVLCEMLDWHFFDRSTAEAALINLGAELGQADVEKKKTSTNNNVLMSVSRILEAYKQPPGK